MLNHLDSDQTEVKLVLILVKAVCKCYQQMTKVAASKERVNYIAILSYSKRMPMCTPHHCDQLAFMVIKVLDCSKSRQ